MLSNMSSMGITTSGYEQKWWWFESTEKRDCQDKNPNLHHFSNPYDIFHLCFLYWEIIHTKYMLQVHYPTINLI